MRFYWKEASAVGGTDAGKAKILRQVTFPKVFDLFEFCTDELKTSLLQGRNLDSQNREAEDTIRLAGLDAAEKKKADAAAGGDVEMADEEEKKDRKKRKEEGSVRSEKETERRK